MESLYTEDRRLSPAGQDLESQIDDELEPIIARWVGKGYDPREVIEVMRACLVQMFAEAMTQIENS